jgi:hypothetical protein
LSWEKERGERGKAELRCDVTENIFLSQIQSVANSFSFNSAIRGRAASAGGQNEVEAEGERKETGKDGVWAGGGMNRRKKTLVIGEKKRGKRKS